MKQPATKYNNDMYGKVKMKGTVKAQPGNVDKCEGKTGIKRR